MEVSKPVRVYEVNLFCDKCGGLMKSDNLVLATYPPQYTYYCEKCGEKTTSHKSYPCIVYKEEEHGLS